MTVSYGFIERDWSGALEDVFHYVENRPCFAGLRDQYARNFHSHILIRVRYDKDTRSYINHLVGMFNRYCDIVTIGEKHFVKVLLPYSHPDLLAFLLFSIRHAYEGVSHARVFNYIKKHVTKENSMAALLFTHACKIDEYGHLYISNSGHNTFSPYGLSLRRAKEICEYIDRRTHTPLLTVYVLPRYKLCLDLVENRGDEWQLDGAICGVPPEKRMPWTTHSPNSVAELIRERSHLPIEQVFKEFVEEVT